MILLLLACTGEPADSGVDTGLCADAPITTWDNYGAGFVIQNCTSCHSATADNREGAPEGVDFDSVEEVWDQADRVLARVVTDATMPPQGGLTEDDRYRVEVWLTCSEDGS